MQQSLAKDDEKSRLRQELLSLGLNRWWSKYARSPDQMRRAMTILGMNFTANSNFELLLRTRALAILKNRPRLPELSSVRDAVRLLQKSKNILVVSGAGISVSCGIPDFRSTGGIYAEILHSGEYDLTDPQQMFDIETFKEDPHIFYSFAHRIFPSAFEPSHSHKFIKCLEDRGKLLRNYTQNIDTLEEKAGVQSVVRCHGSFATASCLKCKQQVPGAEIEAAVMTKTVPLCQLCDSSLSKKKKGGPKKSAKRRKPWEEDGNDEEEPPPAHIMKPDITFFGEKVESDFQRLLDGDRESVDLVLIMGTSMEVKPVSELPAHIPHHVPQILINKTPINHLHPDIALLGDADLIVAHLCRNLRWDLTRVTAQNLETNLEPSRMDGYEHIWLYPGAEVGSLNVAFGGSSIPPETKIVAKESTNVLKHASIRQSKRLKVQ